MKLIDVSGKPCPIPVIEAKKALSGADGEVRIIVDNMIAVQNLEKMAAGYGYEFSYRKDNEAIFEVDIKKL